MRNLALRFVRPLTNPKSADAAVHVVDPHLDLRSRFADSQQFQAEIAQRQLKNINIDRIRQDYEQWWQLHEEYESVNADSELSKTKEIRARLLEHDRALIDALKLPNRLLHEPAFLEDSSVFPDKLQRIRVGTVMETTDALEEALFSATGATRIDPPRIIRPAITEAFNVPTADLIRFHEGQNPSLHLVGISPPGLLSSFVSSRFGSSNTFPMTFLAKGAGYSRSFRGWQKQFVSAVVFAFDRTSLHAELGKLRSVLEALLPGHPPTLTRVQPQDLRSFECAAATICTNSNPVARVSDAGTFLAERLQIQLDVKGATHSEFVRVGFLEVDMAALRP